MAEPDEFALHPPVPPRRIVRRHLDHEHPDRGYRRRPSGTPAARVVPSARDQPPVPGEQRRRGHREHLTPPAAGNQSRQCREPQPVARLVADPADLAAQRPRSRAGAPGARHPWTPGAGSAPSDSRAGNVRAGRQPIGVVRGGRSQIFEDHWGAVVSRLVLEPAVLDRAATDGLSEFSHIEVVFQFHRATRVRRGAAHPRGNPAWPQVGVLAGHSPVRPNHLSVSVCVLLEVAGLELTVQGLDAIDGTLGPGHQAACGRVPAGRPGAGARLDARANDPLLLTLRDSDLSSRDETLPSPPRRGTSTPTRGLLLPDCLHPTDAQTASSGSITSSGPDRPRLRPNGHGVARRKRACPYPCST